MRKLIAILALAAAQSCISRPPEESVIVSNVLGPEGPLYVDGNLYFVGWVSGTLSKWDGKAVTVINRAPNCGHNGLALTARRTFLLACTDEQGSVIELDMTGKELRRWDKDDRGRPFAGGINDIVVAANGGAYATVFGPYNGKPSEVAGRVLYLAPGSDQWVQVANDLNYANGVGVSRDQKTLYVDETVGNCILKFTIEADGTLSHRSNFALLNLLVPNRVEDW
ncbi:MAG TPA: SMP-30/gluconolactonase/LRE family protein, partial [Sphingomicrobium sp.]|nr:SMP-30/gluconolactonase/LRE family protein [Sphingomicrobium sp.]